MIADHFLREMLFYWVVGIIHEHACFRGFIAFEKLKYWARFKVYAIKLKTKSKNFDYSCFQILVFDKRQVKKSRKNTKELKESR